MDIKKSNFFKSINHSNDDVISKRSELVAEDVEQSMRDIVDKLKKEVRTIETSILKSEDFGRTSKDSLRVVPDNFNAEEWAMDLHKQKVKLKSLEIELEIAEENYNFYFGKEE